MRHPPCSALPPFAFDFADGQTFTQGWNAKWSQSGTTVTATNEGRNGTLATGARITVGFVSSSSARDTAPTASRLNGTTCNGVPEPAASPTIPPPPAARRPPPAAGSVPAR